MAFGSFVQTDFGRQLDAKHYAGKGLHFSRLALGDGDIGTASVYDVTALKSEKLSLQIDAVSVTADEAIVTASLLSSLVDTGFNLKEMGLMATDPDTSEEGVYSYNRDSSDGEYVPDKNSATTLSEYLRVRCKVEDTENITFDASGNPLYVTPEDLSAGLAGKADKSTLTTATLPAANWTGDAAPYSQTISVPGILPDPQIVKFDYDHSQDDGTLRAAWKAASISVTAQDTGSLTFVADGDLPTIDLPISIWYGGDV